jgi:hypothetical protein
MTKDIRGTLAVLPMVYQLFSADFVGRRMFYAYLSRSNSTCYMIKIFLTGMALLCVLPYASAQNKLGIKAGANFARVENIYLNGSPTRQSIGFNAGLITQFGLGSGFVLRPELLYSQKGYKYTAPENMAATMHFHYITLPLLAGFYPFKGFTILAGPEFGYMARANARYDDANHNLSKNFNNFEMAVDFGLSYHLKNGLGLEVRYNHGFENLTEVSLTNQQGNITGHKKQGSNRLFQAGIIYIFPDNKK